MKPRNPNGTPSSRPEASQEPQSPFVFTNPAGEQISAEEASESLTALRQAAENGTLSAEDERLTWFKGATYISPSAASLKKNPANPLEIAQSSLLRKEEPASHTITGISVNDKGALQFDVAAVLPKLRNRRSGRITHNPSLSKLVASPLGPRIGHKAQESISLTDFARLVEGFVHPEENFEGASTRKTLGQVALGGASSTEESRKFLRGLSGEADTHATYYVPPALLVERSTTTTNNASVGKKDKITTATFSEADRHLFAVPKGLPTRASKATGMESTPTDAQNDQEQTDEASVARVKVADAYAAAEERKNGKQPDAPEQSADPTAEAAEPIKPSYETSYVNALEAMRNWLRTGDNPNLAVNAALDALKTTDTDLKNEVISDLKGASLIDVNDQVSASDTELRLEQQLELVDALKHNKDLTGARYTLKSGTLIEITEQQGDTNELVYKIRSTNAQGKRGGYTVTAQQFADFLKNN